MGSSGQKKRKPVHKAQRSEYDRAVAEQARERDAVLGTMGLGGLSRTARIVIGAVLAAIVIVALLSWVAFVL